MNRPVPERKTHSLLLPALLAAVAAVAFAVVPAAAAHPEEVQRQTPAAAADNTDESGAVIREGVRVVVDPESGEIVTTSPRTGKGALSDQLANALSRSAEGLEAFDLANGGKGVDLDGRFQHVFVVRLKPDGSFETVCVNHRHQAEKVLHPDDQANAVERAVK